MITIVLRGEPEGRKQPAPRVVTRGRKGPVVYKNGRPLVILHPDKGTVAYQRALAMQAKVVMGSRAPLSGALVVAITAVFSIPTSWSDKKRDAALAGVVYKTGKPDWDNVGKNVGDALKGVVWVEDAIIVDGRVVKVYGEEPMLRIEVREFQEGGGLIAGMTSPGLATVDESL